MSKIKKKIWSTSDSHQTYQMFNQIILVVVTRSPVLSIISYIAMVMGNLRYLQKHHFLARECTFYPLIAKTSSPHLPQIDPVVYTYKNQVLWKCPFQQQSISIGPRRFSHVQTLEHNVCWLKPLAFFASCKPHKFAVTRISVVFCF